MLLTEKQIRRIIREAIEDYEKFGITGVSVSDDAIAQLEIDVQQMLDKVVAGLLQRNYGSYKDAPPEVVKKALAFFGKNLDLNSDAVYGNDADWKLVLRKELSKTNDEISKFLEKAKTTQAIGFEYALNTGASGKHNDIISQMLNEWAYSYDLNSGSLARLDNGKYVFTLDNFLALPTREAYDKNLKVSEGEQIKSHLETGLLSGGITFDKVQVMGYIFECILSLDEDALRRQKNPYVWNIEIRTNSRMYSADQIYDLLILKANKRRRPDLASGKDLINQIIKKSVTLINKYRQITQDKIGEADVLRVGQMQTNIMRSFRELQSRKVEAKFQDKIDQVLLNLLSIANATLPKKLKRHSKEKVELKFETELRWLLENVDLIFKKIGGSVNSSRLNKALDMSADIVDKLESYDASGTYSPELARDKKAKMRDAVRPKPGFELEAIDDVIATGSYEEKSTKNIKVHLEMIRDYLEYYGDTNKARTIVRRMIVNFRLGNYKEAENQMYHLVTEISKGIEEAKSYGYDPYANK